MAYDILLIESNASMREQLADAISASKNFKLLAAYRTAQEAIGQGIVYTPKIVIIDTDVYANSLMLGELGRAFSAAAIICASKRWDAERNKQFAQDGADSFLLKPFTTGDLQEAIDSLSKLAMDDDDSITIAFFSPKGKSGKTTLIANLALAIANKTMENVAIIDADLQFGDMSVFFNLTPQSTIVEAVRDTEFLTPVALSSYFMPVTEHVHVLCGTKDPKLIDRVDIPSLEALINMTRSIYRYVLIDVPPAFNPTSICVAELSDLTYIVTMINDAYELKHVQRALDIFTDWPDYRKRVKMVFTRVNPCTDESARRIEAKVGYPVEGIIPNAYLTVSNAADEGKMAMMLDPNSELSKRINMLADKIIYAK